MLDRVRRKFEHWLRLRPNSGFVEFGSYRGYGLTDQERAMLRANPIGRLFADNEGRLIHKWLHFFAIYERYFARFVDTAPAMLEIGVSQGGSLDMWRAYFGADATIYGIDIDPACADRVTPPNQVRIGSQADPAFLKGVIAEIGPLDIVLDDGSHVADHQRISFETVWPHLKPGGLYMIEDTHTSYWGGWKGGVRRKGTAIEIAKLMVDDMHGWYHKASPNFVSRDEVGGVHFHDSIIVIEKARIDTPKTVEIPAPAPVE